MSKIFQASSIQSPLPKMY